MYYYKIYKDFDIKLIPFKPNGKWKIEWDEYNKCHLYLGKTVLWFFNTWYHEDDLYYLHKRKVYTNECNIHE